MTEYIERTDAMNAVLVGNVDKDFPCMDIAARLHDIPAADVRPVVRGKWVTPTVIDGRTFNIPHCSVCSGVPCGVDEHTKYCPNCGADMREES